MVPLSIVLPLVPSRCLVAQVEHNIPTCRMLAQAHTHSTQSDDQLQGVNVFLLCQNHIAAKTFLVYGISRGSNFVGNSQCFNKSKLSQKILIYVHDVTFNSLF